MSEGMFSDVDVIQRRLNVDATSWRCIDVEATLYKRQFIQHRTSVYTTSLQRRTSGYTTSPQRRCNDVEATLYKRHVPAGYSFSQSKLNFSNTSGSFTMANSHSFLGHSIAQLK